jgi:hypothetical protein
VDDITELLDNLLEQHHEEMKDLKGKMAEMRV